MVCKNLEYRARKKSRVTTKNKFAYCIKRELFLSDASKCAVARCYEE
jgi:hypothetical protein